MPILVRASGPALANFGISNYLPDPTLAVINSSLTQIGYDFKWGGSSVLSNAFSDVGAFSWQSGSNDSALLFATGQSSPALSSLPAGTSYTQDIAGDSGDTGIAMLEIYDANAVTGTTWTAGMPSLINFSTRTLVSGSSGSQILVSGFIISGSTARTVLIRADGPVLSTLGIPSPLPDPQLLLFNNSGTITAANEGWNGNPLVSAEAAAAYAFPWTTVGNDSALVVTLPPGTYSVELVGASGDSGNAQIEVYFLQ